MQNSFFRAVQELEQEKTKRANAEEAHMRTMLKFEMVRAEVERLKEQVKQQQYQQQMQEQTERSV